MSTRQSNTDNLAPSDSNHQQKIAKLEQQVESQAFEIQEQTRRIQRLEAQLAESQLRLNTMPQIDNQLTNFKGEFLQIIEEQYARRQQNFRDVNNAIITQVDGFAQTLRDLRRDIDRMNRYDDQINLTRAEYERLNREFSKFEARLDTLNKQLDGRDRAVNYMEDQRRVDTQRLAELQIQLPELQKKIETSLSRVQLVEQQIPQFAQYQAALDQIREDIRRHRENMDFHMAQRERLMKNWNDAAETQQRRLDEIESQMEKYAEHYQLNKRALESLLEFQDRLQRDQHRANELQRLAENRLQTEMEKWQADYEQRWKKQSMEWKPNFTDLHNSIELLQKQVDHILKQGESAQKQVELIFQIIEEDVHNRTLSAQDWRQRFEELASSQQQD